MSSLSSIFDGVIEESSMVVPIAVLKELAQELNKRTKGLLFAKVEQHIDSENHKFYLEFYITAPYLNNYSYDAFTVNHDLGFYPLSIKSNSGKLVAKAENQEEFEKELKLIFSSSEIKKVINGLLAQVKQVKPITAIDEDGDDIPF